MRVSIPLIVVIALTTAQAAVASQAQSPVVRAHRILASEVRSSAESYVRCRLRKTSDCSVQESRLIKDCTAAIVSRVSTACQEHKEGSSVALLRTALKIHGIDVDDVYDGFRGRSFIVRSPCLEVRDAPAPR